MQRISHTRKEPMSWLSSGKVRKKAAPRHSPPGVLSKSEVKQIIAEMIG